MTRDDQPAARLTDPMDPARAGALLAAHGRPAMVGPGDALPPFFNQIYFWTPEPPANLGRDGHPRTGGLIPDMGLPRRMWAAARLEFHAPLRAGVSAEKATFVEATTRKTGRSGPLAFVTLRNEFRQNGALCVTEWQDIVYREDPDPDAPGPVPPAARSDEDRAQTVDFGSTLLFRYSALTFNGHRIHYDLPYAQEVEGYAGLVVHGPLLAQLLMLMAEDARGPLAAFSFRATAPLMHDETATLCMTDDALWVRGPDGRQCMQATARFAGQAG